MGWQDAGWDIALNPPPETNPATATLPLYDAGGMVINAQVATVTLTPINAGVPQTITLGLKGDRVTDNANIGGVNAIQNLFTALAVLNDGDGTIGAYGFLPAGSYIYRTQPKYSGSGWSLRGAGMRSTTLQPRTFTGAALIADTAGTFPYTDNLIEDLRIEGWNHTNGQGGIVAEGSLRFTARRVFFDGYKLTALQIKGHGIASTGDAMFCIAQECQFNPQNVAGNICIQLSPNGTGGSHPDGFRAINNWVNGNVNSTFLVADVVGATGGWLGADSAVIAFNRVEGCAIYCDINGKNFLFLGERAEVTSGTMAITIEAGPANFGSVGNVFIGGSFSTAGVRTNLLITDNGSNTRWIAVGNVGSASGVTSGTLAGGTSTLDPSVSDEWLLTMSASTTIVLPNFLKGQRTVIHLIHDATATAFTLTWPGTVKFAGGAFGTNKAGTNTANALDSVTLDFDGTNHREVARALALA